MNWKLAPLTLVGGMTLLSLATVATAQTASAEPVSRKLERQISVMEKVLDEALLDSPNILVYSSSPSHGIYLDEFGALFTFEASLVERGDQDDWGKWWKNNIRIDREGGKITVYTHDDEEDPDKDKDSKVKDDDEMTDEEWSKWRTKRDEAEAKLYERGKKELMHTLLDYGDTLTGLRDNQWVAIAAFLKNSDFFTENRISRLVFKAKMSDLRAFGEGTITEEVMLSRLVEEEY